MRVAYFLGNVLVGVRVVFLPNCPLVLSLLKYRGVGIFLNKKMRIPNNESSLNNREMLRLQQFYNIFTTNHRWLVVIGSNLKLIARLPFCPNNNN